MKQTKIICTMGPASDSIEVMKELVKEGMNCARMNFSHGDHTYHAENMAKIRQVNAELGTHVGILLDTKGPEIRTHEFDGGQAELVTGETVTISMTEVLGTKEMFSITYGHLVKDVEIGSNILIDDGLISLEVTGLTENTIICKILNNGIVKNKKGINVPNIKLGMDFVSEKDANDIKFGATQDVDYIAASFTRRASDILEIKQILKDCGNESIKIIAKIENQEGLDNLDEIIKVADGIMVARGDLGVEVPLEVVPVAQKVMIKKCNAAGKIVITATQMLDSMQKNPRPTRAETTDVANAILDGSDCVMLSGETAAGLYPVESVKVMSSIAQYIESETMDYQLIYDRQVKTMANDTSSAIAISVASTSLRLHPKAVVASTVSGYTARLISAFRVPMPIIAVTHLPKTATQLSLNWGVHPVITKFVEDVDSITAEAKNTMINKFGAVEGDRYIITAGVPTAKANHTNFMKIEEL